MRTVPVPPPVRRSIESLQARGKEAWARLEKRVRPKSEPAVAEPAAVSTKRPVVLIHGLNVPKQTMLPVGMRLQRHYGRSCHNLSYPWSHRDIPRTAQFIAEQIKALGLTDFDAVTHSMGGIVLRWAVANHDLPPVRRAVMIAPPNSGAWIADHLSRRLGWAYPWIFGEAALQLRHSPFGLADRAGTLPGTEVGVIAGGSGKPEGIRNWFGIPGDCDGTVAVQETILSGMKDFALVEANHTMVGMRAETARLVDHFLTHGVFRHRKHGHRDED